MKLAVVTCLWKRPRVTALSLRRIARAAAGVAPLLVAVGSEGPISRKLAIDAGWSYEEASNRPLGRKWNRGAQAAYAAGADGVVILGSDDWVDAGLLRALASMAKSHACIGLRDQYMLRVSDLAMLHFRGYQGDRAGDPVGVGRLLRRDVLKKLAQAPWPANVERGLDGHMTGRLRSLGIRPRLTTMRELGGAVIDLKTDENMWSFDAFERNPHLHRSRRVDAMQVLRRFPRSEVRTLLQLGGHQLPEPEKEEPRSRPERIDARRNPRPGKIGIRKVR